MLKLAAALLCVVVLGAWLWLERPIMQRGRTFAKDYTAAVLYMTVSGFAGQENTLTGTVSLRFSPPSSGEIDAETLKGIKNFLFQIEIPEEDEDGQRYILIVGESVKPMAMVWTLEPRAQDTFRWIIRPLSRPLSCLLSPLACPLASPSYPLGPLAYPFDRYEARMTPALFGSSGADNSGSWVQLPVETVGADFSGVNFTTSFSGGQEDGTWFTLVLERPLWLRLVAAIALVLITLWALWFPFTPKAGEPAGLLAVFAGVFTIRTSLLSGAPVFPTLIDYFSLLLYIYVLIVILVTHVRTQPSRKCPFCKSSVHDGAEVCAACTRYIGTASA